MKPQRSYIYVALTDLPKNPQMKPYVGKHLQGWVETGKSRDETRRDKDKVLKFFRDKTRRDIVSRLINSRQPKTAKGMSRQDKTYKFSVI